MLLQEYLVRLQPRDPALRANMQQMDPSTWCVRHLRAIETCMPAECIAAQPPCARTRTASPDSPAPSSSSATCENRLKYCQIPALYSIIQNDTAPRLMNKPLSCKKMSPQKPRLPSGPPISPVS